MTCRVHTNLSVFIWSWKRSTSGVSDMVSVPPLSSLSLLYACVVVLPSSFIYKFIIRIFIFQVSQEINSVSDPDWKRIQLGLGRQKMTHKNKKKGSKFLCFEVLDALLGELEVSPVW
jgi:hypothetical protein